MNLPDWRLSHSNQESWPSRSRTETGWSSGSPATATRASSTGSASATSIRGEIVSEQGLCATAATSVRARQRLRGGLGRLLQGLRRSSKNRDFSAAGRLVLRAMRRATNRPAAGLVAGGREPDRRVARSSRPGRRRSACRRLCENFTWLPESRPRRARPSSRTSGSEPEPAARQPAGTGRATAGRGTPGRRPRGRGHGARPTWA